MPNDAKCGLVVGLTLVIIIAVVFFRKSGAAEDTLTTDPGKQAVRTAGVPGRGVRHVVQQGDTLYSLARRYYKDDAKFVEIFQNNRAVLRSPEVLTPGTVLVIPGVTDVVMTPRTLAAEVVSSSKP